MVKIRNERRKKSNSFANMAWSQWILSPVWRSLDFFSRIIHVIHESANCLRGWVNQFERKVKQSNHLLDQNLNAYPCGVMSEWDDSNFDRNGIKFESKINKDRKSLAFNGIPIEQAIHLKFKEWRVADRFLMNMYLITLKRSPRQICKNFAFVFEWLVSVVLLKETISKYQWRSEIIGIFLEAFDFRKRTFMRSHDKEIKYGKKHTNNSNVCEAVN